LYTGAALTGNVRAVPKNYSTRDDQLSRWKIAQKINLPDARNLAILPIAILVECDIL